MTNYNNPKGNRDEIDRVDPNITNDETQYQRERAAENSGAASGIAVGATIAALLGLGAVGIYYLGRPNPTPTTIINPPASPVTSTTPKPAQPTKIIERTIEKPAPPAPAPQIIEVPKPILVPGATRTIEVPKPYPVPAAPSPAKDPAPPKANPSPASTPAPTLNQSPAPSESPAPTTPSNGNN
jgi:periplasmic protein TonB